MTLFSIFRSLGLAVSVRPMLDPNDLNRLNEERSDGEVFRVGHKFEMTAIEDYSYPERTVKEEEEVSKACSSITGGMKLIPDRMCKSFSHTCLQIISLG